MSDQLTNVKIILVKLEGNAHKFRKQKTKNREPFHFYFFFFENAF